MSDPSENDANLSLEARAIVRELRRGNEASERIAVALERIAEASETFVDESFRTEIVAE